MPRPTFQAAGALAETASSATLGIVAPATRPGDIMIAMYHANDNLVVTLPSGWNSMGQNDNTVDQTVLVAWKLAGTADSGATFNFIKSANNSLLSCGVIVTYRGARIGSPFHTATASYKNNTASDNITFNDYTVPAGVNRVLFLVFYGLGATTMGAFTGTTIDASINNRFEDEATLGTTATLCHLQGSSTVAGALGVGSEVSASTVDAISVGAVVALISDENQAGYSSTSYGQAQGPGSRSRPNPRGKTEQN